MTIDGMHAKKLVALSTILLLQYSALCQTKPDDDSVKPLVGRLNLERYKATIRGLTRFGDRRQGTDRNRAAIDWIEAQLKSHGCTNTGRLRYVYEPPPPAAARVRAPAADRGPASTNADNGAATLAVGDGRPRGVRTPTSVNTDPNAQWDVKLRELNSQPTTPGPREEVYCTK